MKSVMYQGYQIRSFPLRQIEAGQWNINISISWHCDGAVTMRPFSASASYPTEEEADVHGITFGQRIIDGKVAGMSVT